MFEVTLSFNDQGECQLKVNGEERDYWQVRRMALEELMFRGISELSFWCESVARLLEAKRDDIPLDYPCYNPVFPVA